MPYSNIQAFEKLSLWQTALFFFVILSRMKTYSKYYINVVSYCLFGVPDYIYVLIDLYLLLLEQEAL